MLARLQHSLGHGKVEHIGRGDVDGLHGRIGQQFIHARVASGQVQAVGSDLRLFGRCVQNARNTNAQPAQRLGVRGSHKAGADDCGVEFQT